MSIKQNSFNSLPTVVVYSLVWKIMFYLFSSSWKNTKILKRMKRFWPLGLLFQVSEDYSKGIEGCYICFSLSSRPSIDSFRSLKCVHGHLSVNYKEGGSLKMCL
jgi:hypothetical protein